MEVINFTFLLNYFKYIFKLISIKPWVFLEQSFSFMLAHTSRYIVSRLKQINRQNRRLLIRKTRRFNIERFFVLNYPHMHIMDIMNAIIFLFITRLNRLLSFLFYLFFPFSRLLLLSRLICVVCRRNIYNFLHD